MTHLTRSSQQNDALNKNSEKPLGSSGPFYLSDVQMNISCVCGSPLLKHLTLPLTWDCGLPTHIWLILKQFEEFSGSCYRLQYYSAQTVSGQAFCRQLRHSPLGTVDLFMLWIFCFFIKRSSTFKDVLKTLKGLPWLGLPCIYTQRQSFKWLPLKHFPCFEIQN